MNQHSYFVNKYFESQLQGIASQEKHENVVKEFSLTFAFLDSKVVFEVTVLWLSLVTDFKPVDNLYLLHKETNKNFSVSRSLCTIMK